jgi:YesN/AraC family two-component response regulator
MKRILVVEDNRLERKLLLHILREYLTDDVQIDEAAEGHSALKYIERKPYDLVITDLIMPRVEGMELIRKIKSQSAACNILAISGGNPYYLYLAKKLGIQGIFTKPLDKDRFLQQVSSILKSALSN